MSKPKEEFSFDAANFTVDALQKQDDAEAQKEEKQREKESEKKASARASEKMVESAIKMSEQREKMSLKRQEKTQAEIEDAEKKALEAKIKKYLQAFPQLASIVPRPSARPSKPELEQILGEIRDSISSARSINRIRNYANQACMFIETTWGDGSGAPAWVPPKARINLLGLTKYYQMGAFEAELGPLLQEIDIEYPWLGRSNLLMRASEAIVTACAKTHAINTNPKAREMFLGEAPPQKDVDVHDL